MCTILAHLTVEQANSILDRERATEAPGPLAAAVMDDKVTVVLIYHSNEHVEPLQSRVKITTTTAIRDTYPSGCKRKDTLSTIARTPSARELEPNSCRIRNTSGQRTNFYFNIPPAAIHWATIRGANTHPVVWNK